jgi:hypothetical protein
VPRFCLPPASIRESCRRCWTTSRCKSPSICTAT